LEKLAKECGEKAVMMMNAKECPSGRFPVVITNGWGGVIFHEACGHSLEATATAKHLSVFQRFDRPANCQPDRLGVR
jgi:TldD protein